jgi:predicted RNA-binding protein YlqC (UPF0109 family)
LVADLPGEVAFGVIPAREKSTTFRIKVSASDQGKVIGRQGRTSQSLRVRAGAMGKKLSGRFVVEIDDDQSALAVAGPS